MLHAVSVCVCGDGCLRRKEKVVEKEVAVRRGVRSGYRVEQRARVSCVFTHRDLRSKGRPKSSCVEDPNRQ